GRNGVEALLLQNILLDDGSKEGLQIRTVSIQYDQAVVLKQGMHQLTGSIRKVSPLVVCIFYQGGELTRTDGKPQHAARWAYGLFHGCCVRTACPRLCRHIPCDFLPVDRCMIYFSKLMVFCGHPIYRHKILDRELLFQDLSQAN